MPKYRFEELAINCTKKRVPTEEEYSTYIGLEHMDTGEIFISRWGSDVPIIGEKLIMKKGDVLLGKRNAYLRRAAIAPHDGVFSAHGMVLEPITKNVDADFFPLFIASDYFFDSAIQISVGSLSPTINWKDLKNLEFELPALGVQKQLAEVLWSIKNVEYDYKKLIKLSDELIKAEYERMLNENDCDAVPLSTLTTIEKGEQINGERLSEEGEYPYFNGGIEASGFWDDFNTESDTISISEGGNSCGFVNYQEERFWCGGHCYRLLNVKCNNRFLYHQLKAREEEIMNLRSGSCMPNIKKSSIQSFIVYVPSEKEQTAFANKCALIEKAKADAILALNSLKKTYLKIINKHLNNREE